MRPMHVGTPVPWVAMHPYWAYVATHNLHARCTKNAHTGFGTLKCLHVVSDAAQLRSAVWDSSSPPPLARPLARARWAEVGRVLDPRRGGPRRHHNGALREL